VKRLDIVKLEPRSEECQFVGIDSESKGYRVYWPGKNRVSVERDVYFNENQVLEPEEVPIEGGNDILTNSDHPQPSNTQNDVTTKSKKAENQRSRSGKPVEYSLASQSSHNSLLN
jgi:BRCT domain type II-containing protein